MSIASKALLKIDSPSLRSADLMGKLYGDVTERPDDLLTVLTAIIEDLEDLRDSSFNTIDAVYLDPEFRPACTVKRTADFSVASATPTAIPFTATEDDNFSLHDNSINNTRITFPRDGQWAFGFNVRFEGNAGGTFRNAYVRKNGSVILLSADESVISTVVVDIEGASTRRFKLNDYIEVITDHNAGVALNIQAVSDHSPIFWAVFLSP